MTRQRRGMTLIELLVVIMVMILLAGIVFASVTNMQRSHDQFVCLSHLRQLHQALGMYQADEQGFPPFDISEAEEYATGMPAINAGIVEWGGGNPAHPTGLWILAETTGHLKSPDTLNCPSVETVTTLDSGGTETLIDGSVAGQGVESFANWYESWFYCSYHNYDPEVQDWQYLPIRDLAATSGPEYQRQLWDARKAYVDGATGDMVCPGMQRYSPSGQAILLWCPHHREDGDGGRRENTLVLYENGSVEVKHRFVDWFDAGDPAWTYPPRDPDWW